MRSGNLQRPNQPQIPINLLLFLPLPSELLANRILLLLQLLSAHSVALPLPLSLSLRLPQTCLAHFPKIIQIQVPAAELGLPRVTPTSRLRLLPLPRIFLEARRPLLRPKLLQILILRHLSLALVILPTPHHCLGYSAQQQVGLHSYNSRATSLGQAPLGFSPPRQRHNPRREYFPLFS